MELVESSCLELKEIVDAELKKEIIAFANTDGGEIYIGVSKNGKTIGVENSEKEVERVSSMIRDGIKPDLAAYTSIGTVKEEGKILIKVCVMRGEKRPYHLSDKGFKPSGVYVRHGVTSALASEEAIRRMIMESEVTTFEKARSINQDLTFEYANQYFKERNIDFTDLNMHSLGLINNDGYFTNAALLFSEQCEHSIKCAVYDGDGKTKFKSRKEFFGSILKQLEDTYEFISSNNNVNSDFERLNRRDIYDYPQFAVREALLNTIVHRDYDYSGSILVNIFSNRIEFVSIGGLVKGITLTDIMHGISQSRNMTLASIFYRLELIESYGTGIQRIVESYDGSMEEPEFLPAPASFLVLLPNMHTVAKTPVNSLLTVEEQVLQLLHNKKEISRKDVEVLLKCSSFPANKILKVLLDKGKIYRVGSARSTRYVKN